MAQSIAIHIIGGASEAQANDVLTLTRRQEIPTLGHVEAWSIYDGGSYVRGRYDCVR